MSKIIVAILTHCRKVKTQNQRYLWNEAVCNLHQNYYRVSIETRVWPINWWQIWWPRVNFGLIFRGAKFFHKGYLKHILSEHNKILQRWGMANQNLFPDFPELWSGDSLIPCGDMHLSFTDAFVKWFFDNFPCLPIVLELFLFSVLPED